MADVIETIVGATDLMFCGPGSDFADGGPGFDISVACEVNVDVEVIL